MAQIPEIRKSRHDNKGIKQVSYLGARNTSDTIFKETIWNMVKTCRLRAMSVTIDSLTGKERKGKELYLSV